MLWILGCNPPFPWRHQKSQALHSDQRPILQSKLGTYVAYCYVKEDRVLVVRFPGEPIRADPSDGAWALAMIDGIVASASS
jgi:hypothetical protein